MQGKEQEERLKRLNQKKITMTNKDFPEIPCEFRDLFLSLPSLKDDGNPSVRAHVRRSAYSTGFYFAHTATLIRLPSREQTALG